MTNKIHGGSLQPCKKCGQQWCDCKKKKENKVPK